MTISYVVLSLFWQARQARPENRSNRLVYMGLNMDMDMWRVTAQGVYGTWSLEGWKEGKIYSYQRTRRAVLSRGTGFDEIKRSIYLALQNSNSTTEAIAMAE